MSFSLGAGPQGAHLHTYKRANKSCPSQQSGTAILCRDVGRQRPASFSCRDGVKFAPACVSSAAPHFLLRDRLNINGATHVFGRGEGKGRGDPCLAISRGRRQGGSQPRGPAAERRQRWALPPRRASGGRPAASGRFPQGEEARAGAGSSLETLPASSCLPRDEGASGARRQREGGRRHPRGARVSDAGNPSGAINRFPAEGAGG